MKQGIALALAAALSGVAAAEEDGYSARVGRAHPDFVLPSVAETAPVVLSRFRGRKLLLLHLASW